MTLYEMKMKLATVGEELKVVSDKIVASASNPGVSQEEIQELKAKQADLKERFAILKEAHDEEVKAQEAEMKRKHPGAKGETDAAKVIAAKAEFIRAKAENRPMSAEAKEILATVTPLRALPAISETGDSLLPTNMDDQLIHEPFVKNHLRGKIGMTTIKGLELPKIDFELDDDDFITDAQTAKEIQLTGSNVAFGKNKFKVKVRIADTVLHGSDVDLVTYVENALRSGLAAKERKSAFAEGDALVVNSFYEDDGEVTAAYLIKEVNGETMYEAITNALADLHEDYRENAQVCMRYVDYVTMLKELSNSSVALFGKPPEEIIGVPVFFTDAAAIAGASPGDPKIGVPIVGDFRNYHINYDPTTIYDSDKNVDSGEYIWVLTAWFDAKFKLRSAFRLAVVVDEG